MALQIGELFASIELDDSGFRAGLSSASAAFHSFASEATVALPAQIRSQGGSQMSSSGQYVGRMLASGIASGIQAGKSGVVNAAVSVVKAAVSAANSAAKIGSPSKVTAEMGKFWDQGWARGILRNAGVVTGAAADMVGRAANAAQLRDPGEGVRIAPAPSGAQGAAAIDYDALAEAMNQRQMTLYMNDRRVAQVLAGETARAQNSRNRSIALGYGK